ncbi:Dimethylaniline monooxygenase, N-oxide-forming [Cynara cardunculus var. scolymus]|uniref:Flavin-containing monooxygenase n=1 Tax=Cynara cardunculus var. scolymus TaxID=59895 RepID=A0A124SGW9_CYNCS|nr:Dimethylaniline monooxygenase, N-oxide-forming [Cynara cardunculus var. scolymus]
MAGDKQIAVVGAGISGLLACKHLMEKGFRPVVFESRSCVGGVWAFQTVESTKLQTPKTYYQFSDFAWPPSVTAAFPDHNQVWQYIYSYSVYFNLIPAIKFNHKVVAIDYSLPLDDEKICGWDEWGGNGGPFSVEGKWKMLVQHTVYPLEAPKVFEVDFVILCNGNYSDFPNVPQFPIDKGPKVFDGVAIHSMDYATMTTIDAAEFIKGKRVTVVGFQKSAIDIAVETVHWTVPEHLNELSFRNLNRFSELMIHKPREGFFLWLLAILLYPLVTSSSFRQFFELIKHNMIPKHGFITQLASCMLPVLPPNFYERVEEGSIVLKNSQSFHFSRNGIVLDDDPLPIETDIVIFATGFRPDEKIAKIFKSTFFQGCIFGSSTPFYRECIHPRIPQVAILGYSESPANLFATEMRSKWLAHFMAGNMKLPTISAMEEDTIKWEMCMRQYAFKSYKRACIGLLLQIHSNDLLCNDMGCNPRRKSWFLPELFAPYVPPDYANL